MSGDITVNCFRIAKPLKSNPMALAGEVVEWLKNHQDVENVEAIKAFVNITLKNEALFRDCVADQQALLDAALLPADKRKRYLVEYSAPNTNKPQHLGHVRNNTLGQVNCSLLARVGHDVTPVNLVNDRGIHICKSMLAYERFGNGDTPESTTTKGDHFVGNYYVKYAQEDKRQAEAEPEQKPTEIERSAQQMLVAWEKGDLGVRSLWQKMNSWVLDGFNQTYQRMGIQFTQTYYESETFRAGKDIVRQGLEKGVFYKREDGAIEIDLTSRKLDKKVVLRSDGTSVYITQDIGTTLMKFEDFKPDAMVWVVGDEQIYHFKVLFAILQDLGYSWANDLHHLAYGMVNLPEGRMKSREGTVVDADDLFDECARLAKEETLERWPDLDKDEAVTRGDIIGMAALKFMLLKVNPKTTMTFDPKASIQFEGDTGPYVLYNFARSCAVQRKAADKDIVLADTIDWSVLSHSSERALAIELSRYGQILQDAAADLNPSLVADYLLSLARAFSKFWTDCPVLIAETDDLKQARLALCIRVQSILGDGIDTLTLGKLESM